MMNSAASRKAENQTMEEILNSIRRIIVDDQKAASGGHLEELSAKQEPTPVPPAETTIDDDILALRTALNAIRDEMNDIQANVSISAPDDFNVDKMDAEPAALFNETRDQELLSPESEISVRRSFATLSAAIGAEGGRVDIENTARDLLRPMLQQWLDNNLPALVERLVKEEIARIVGKSE